jgi:hypothetical protein
MITVGNELTMKAKNIGKLRRCIFQCSGRTFEITLENVKFAPDL